MQNIKFIGREKEINELNKISSDNFFLVLKGRRRIGKTLLLKKAFSNGVYIFVWPDKSQDWIVNQICNEYKLPSFKSFSDILVYLINQKKIVVIDEFQNFINIDKSIYGEIQKIIDERKMQNKFIKIAVAGSSYSLMNKVFNSSASPLYGRRTNEIMLDNLPIVDLFNELKFKIDDFIKTWAVFEGVPYYYELINLKMSSEDNIKRLILLKEAQLRDEGKVLLSIEFGKDSKTYTTILSGIAEGKTKLNELASLFDNKKGEVNKYLDTLRKEFKLIKKTTPITENPDKSKDGRYEIIDNFLFFWFCFIDNLRNYIEQERFSELEAFFDSNFNSFVGKKFEKFIINLIKEKILLKNLDFTKIGRQWGKFKGEKGKNTYEIDIVALNDKTNEILFGECKWQDKVNSEKIVKELLEKSKYVNWNNDNRKESFVIFAKSFSKKINEFEDKKVCCLDLKDIENNLRNR